MVWGRGGWLVDTQLHFYLYFLLVELSIVVPERI